jgi:PAS domain S-box-containing protein
MTNDLRRSGIGAVGDIPWSTHFCHFYESKRDLLDVLVPYFKAGLEQNEFCIWGVFDPIDEHEAMEALEHALPGARARSSAGDIEFVGQSALEQPTRDWDARLESALARGCAGMRVNVSSAWLAAKGRQDLNAYEDELGRIIANRRMIVLCAYQLVDSKTADIFEAAYTHRFAIAKRHGNWRVVETPELQQARADVEQLNAELRHRTIERTKELATAETDKRHNLEALGRAEQALQACGERSLCYFELGLVGMAIVSPIKGCLEVNDRLCDILGYERRELLRITWAALTHPDDLAGDIANYDKVLAGEVDGYQVPKRWLHKNGEVVHTNVSVKCQRHQDGSVNYFAAMIGEASGPTTAGLPDPTDLSQREREVLRLIGSGMTVKEVATALALSEKTVSTYRTRVLTKLKLKTTAELIRYAIKQHLIS